MKQKQWDKQRYFPDTGPNGANPLPNETHPDAANPLAGDVIEVECRDPHTTYPDAPPQYYTIRYNPLNPHESIPQHLRLQSWRHLDEDTARRWQAWQDRMAELSS